MSDVYVCIYKQASMQVRLGGSGGCSPREFLEIKCSEISSGAISGHSSCYFIQFLAGHAFHKPNFHERRYQSWQNSRWDGQLVNSRASDIAINLRT